MYNNDEPNHDKTNTVPKALSEDSPVLPFIMSDLGHEVIKLFFVLNSSEHKNSTSQKTETLKKIGIPCFSALI